jgi:GNAT superfamily N-acetyltransferase
MNFRMATEADVALLARMNKHLIEDEGHSNSMTLAQLAQRMRGWITAGTYKAVLFEQDDQPVAYALYRNDPSSVYLRHFFVERDWRRQGVGRRALRLLRETVLPAGKPVQVDVLAANERGRAFWEALGFENYVVRMVLPPISPSSLTFGATAGTNDNQGDTGSSEM